MLTALRSMKTIWIFLCRLVVFPWLRWGLYGAWSQVYRFFWQRKYKSIEIKPWANIDLLISVLNYGRAWRTDSWRALGDAFDYPGYVQEVLVGSEPQPDHDFDCDDFAVFTSTAIGVSKAHPKVAQSWRDIESAKILTVTWMDGSVPKGHNVVLLTYIPEESVGTQYAYMDYEGPSKKLNSINEVANLVRSDYHTNDWNGIVWCVSDINLKPLQAYWG